MYISLHVTYPLFLSELNETSVTEQIFIKSDFNIFRKHDETVLRTRLKRPKACWKLNADSLIFA